MAKIDIPRTERVFLERAEATIPVLIAGGGTVGLSAALFLAHHGVPALAVERRAGISIHPRALGIGVRSVEIFRQMGLEEPVRALGGRLAAGQGRISARNLASADWTSLPKRGAPAAAPATNSSAALSPVQGGLCSQDLLDEILLTAARERGAEIRFGTEVVAIEPDAEGVTATLAEGASRRTVRAGYLIVADGAGGGLREALGVPASGRGLIGGPIVNILFRADLSEVTQERDLFLGVLTNDELRPGLLITVNGRDRWILHVPYDPERETRGGFHPGALPGSGGARRGRRAGSAGGDP